MTRPRLLLTGATGLIGRAIVSELEGREDVELLALSRHGGIVGCTTVEAVDLGDRRSVEEWVGRAGAVDVVMHVAASAPATFHGPGADHTLPENVSQTAGALSVLAPRGRVVDFYVEVSNSGT